MKNTVERIKNTVGQPSHYFAEADTVAMLAIATALLALTAPVLALLAMWND